MSETPEQAGPILIELDLDSTVNFAMQQNDVPIVKLLRIKNTGERPVQNLLIRIFGEPEFAAPTELRIDSIPPGGAHSLGPVDLKLSAAYLLQLTERVGGLLHVQVMAGEHCLARHSQPIEVLAYDEWSGTRSLPEILAAFVLPNHPIVEGILSRAASILREWTGDASLSGYQSRDADRALKIVAAIYTALQHEEIRYISPPASFESMGQKIRLPDRILEHRLATCLDLAALAAGCIEQAGLFPLVAITKGHAFVGAWLEEECFADPATDDGIRLRKRVDLGEVCVFETTLIIAQPPVDFSHAAAMARRLLEDAEQFHCVIDIQRCRKSHIRPLPIRAGGQVQDGHETAPSGKSPPQPFLPPDISILGPSAGQASLESIPMAAETPASRLERWKRKLLDLTLHNRLLNFRGTKKTLPILCPDLAALEDALADGEKFQVHPRLAEMVEDHPRSAEVHLQRTGEDTIRELLLGEFVARRLRADVTTAELEGRLLEIYRAAKLSLEEGGANILYLALGFLSWYESSTSTQPRVAPIILIPLELERPSVQQGFRIRQADEEPRVNVTLLEMLSKDFVLQIPGLDPIPEDEHGIDVRGILTSFRKAVKEIDRWEVIEDAQVGLFSFTKFVMWHDLQARTEDLEKNKVVAHLVHRPNRPFPHDGEFPQPDHLDHKYKPEETFCPLSSDSSQLAAVYAAAEGKSFVLEGPPGTGKSQTITNLIAHSLACGKTVLFVSEKMAALNVVHSRLRECGLEPFCLELHSSKSHKMEVVQRLGMPLDLAAQKSSEEWQRHARRLATLRAELNTYVEALHRKRQTGESVFQATSRLIGLREVQPLELRWPSVEEMDRECLEGLREVVDRMRVAGQACGHPGGNCWAAAECETWSPTLQREVEGAIQRLAECTQQLARSAQAIAPLLDLGKGNWGSKWLDFARQIVTFLPTAPAMPAGLLTESDWQEVQWSIESWIEHGRRRDTLRTELYSRYSDSILKLDLDGLSQRLAKAQAAWPLARWWGKRSIRQELARTAQPGQVLTTEALGPDLDNARALRAEAAAVAAGGDRARQLLGATWKDGEADWSAIQQMREWSQSFRKLALRAAGGDPGRAAALQARWARLVTESRDLLKPEAKIGRAFRNYCQLHKQFLEAKQGLEAKLALQLEAAWGDENRSGLLERIATRLTEWSGRLNGLRAWCNWRMVRQEAIRLGLQPLVHAYERGGLPTADLSRVFERSFYQWWVDGVTETEPALRGFFSPEHERRIQQFREMDERYAKLAEQEVQARLAARVPVASNRVSENSEMGILRRQMQKRRGHLPVRKLFEQIPNLLPRLKPCLLMSPISVAQYLDPAHPPFDLVVFDEASQIPPWDAIGAIARGQEAVIVGDPKQLPPTNFFSRSDEQELNDDDVVEDMESILDDCIAAQLPWLQLRWHYRSRHESLIAFSNQNYYDNRLLTFPSPHRDMGVSWRPVHGGIYDKGKSRTNRAEAEAVVGEILRRLQDAELSQRSIGVVTFSLAQQTLLEDLLDEARRQYPEIESFFGEEAGEPIFVKNLENVQGDERDVILFSICYGPDAQGRVSMNFGPLNRDGGERRLNVAVTRARQELIIFSTLRGDQIDLARTRARGVRDLKCFLDYAERGPAAMAEASQFRPEAEFESPFEQQVCEALRQGGHEVHIQVGCSGYRIDLAVVDPEMPGRYLLGIECDGANYHRAKTARDRDRLREAVLIGLGWRLHRVWSSDWWENPKETLAKIEAAIERAKQTRTQDAGRRPDERPRATAAAPDHPAVMAVDDDVERFAPAGLLCRAPVMNAHDQELRATAPKLAVSSTPGLDGHLTVYRPFKIGRLKGRPEDFYDSRAGESIRTLIEAVVRQEGPVVIDLVARRVAAHWGMMRLGERILERVSLLGRSANVRVVTQGQEIFFWPADVPPRSYRFFRVPSAEDASRREIGDLPPEEIANAARHVLAQQVSLPMPDLVRETARLFGFQRTGATVERGCRRGIDLLLASGAVREQDGVVVHVC